MSTPQESLEAIGVQLDREAAALAARVLRLRVVHERALERTVVDETSRALKPCSPTRS